MLRKQTMAVQCANICPIEYENYKTCHLRIFSRFLCVFIVYDLSVEADVNAEHWPGQVYISVYGL